jgi:mono/diheme cytochrome c family protein/YHS domain-containing protein
MRIVAAVLLLLVPLAAQAKVDFQKQIAPILVQRCIECHGPKEQKGDLRLDSRAFAFLEGEEDAWSILPKQPDSSELMIRLGLPLDDEDIMPAKGEPLSKEQQALFRQWIQEGADWPEAGDQWIAGELAAQVLPKITFALPPVDEAQQKAIDAAIAALRQKGMVVQSVAADTNAVEVNLSLLRDKVGDAELAMLRPLAPVLVWLNASRTAVTDAGAKHIGALTELRRLNLANTKLGDKGYSALMPLKQLEYLNAYGTELADDGLAMVASLPKLRQLYAWQTKVGADAVRSAREQFARVQIDLGDYVEERLAAAKQEIESRAERQKPINDKCPVTDAEIDVAQFVEHEGRRVAFCCEKCKAKFVADPAKFADKLPAKKADAQAAKDAAKQPGK